MARAPKQKSAGKSRKATNKASKKSVKQVKKTSARASKKVVTKVVKNVKTQPRSAKSNAQTQRTARKSKPKAPPKARKTTTKTSTSKKNQTTRQKRPRSSSRSSSNVRNKRTKTTQKTSNSRSRRRSTSPSPHASPSQNMSGTQLNSSARIPLNKHGSGPTSRAKGGLETDKSSKLNDHMIGDVDISAAKVVDKSPPKYASPKTFPNFLPIKSQNSINRPNRFVRPVGQTQMIVMVGCPYAGKSTWIKDNFQAGFVGLFWPGQLSDNQIRTYIHEGTAKGLPVVIDMENGKLEDRARVVALAKQAGMKCTCVHLTTSRQQASVNFQFDKSANSPDADVNKAKNRLIHYFDNFVQPTEKEGFDEVVDADFRVSFANNHERLTYQQLIHDMKSGNIQPF